jgi:hypothetical protein
VVKLNEKLSKDNPVKVLKLGKVDNERGLHEKTREEISMIESLKL